MTRTKNIVPRTPAQYSAVGSRAITVKMSRGMPTMMQYSERNIAMKSVRSMGLGSGHFLECAFARQGELEM
jgi:hypothetical protein